MKRFLFYSFDGFYCCKCVSRRWNLKCLVALSLVRHVEMGRMEGFGLVSDMRKSPQKRHLLREFHFGCSVCCEIKKSTRDDRRRVSRSTCNIDLKYCFIDFPPPHLIVDLINFSTFSLFLFCSLSFDALTNANCWFFSSFSIVRHRSTALCVGKCAKINAALRLSSLLREIVKCGFFPHSYSFFPTCRFVQFISFERAFIFHFFPLHPVLHFQMLSIGKQKKNWRKKARANNMKACLWNEMLTCK